MASAPHIVLLAARGGASYGVLKALRAIGASVDLICDCRSAIRLTRYGRPLYVSRDLSCEPAAHIAEIVNELHLRNPVDVVVPSDVAATKTLNLIKADLIPPVFPCSDSNVLRQLDNKWRFYRLCVSLGIPVPQSIYFASKSAVDPFRIKREIGYPVVVKPVDEMGGDGVVVAGSEATIAARVLGGGYRFGQGGMIVQRYVRGQDWGYAAFAVDGRIETEVTFACGPNWRSHFRNEGKLLAAARRIIEQVRYTGVVNFDCRLDCETDTFKFFECNPRFFHRVTAARLCGLNFLNAGQHRSDQVPDGVSYFPIRDVLTREGLRALWRGAWPLSALATDVMEALADPLPALFQNTSWAPAALKAVAPVLQRTVPSKVRRVQ
ncbi:MAG: hypothetical protein ACM30I_08620 [Gemmatimonas sp.]